MSAHANKFASVPVDADTRITAQQLVQVNGWDALHQRWVWEGVSAQSLVFVASDIADASDETLLQMAADADLHKADEDHTVTRSDSGFVFLNFGFE